MIKRRENTQIYGVPTFMCTFKLLFHETCNGGLGILCFVNYNLFPQIFHSKLYSFYNFLLDKSCQVLVHLRHLYLGSQNTFHVIKQRHRNHVLFASGIVGICILNYAWNTPKYYHPNHGVCQFKFISILKPLYIYASS
jgi:hypothetical protein